MHKLDRNHRRTCQDLFLQSAQETKSPFTGFVNAKVKFFQPFKESLQQFICQLGAESVSFPFSSLKGFWTTVRRLRGWRWQKCDVAIETSLTSTRLFVFVGLIHFSFSGNAEGSLGETEARHWCKIFLIFSNDLRNTWGSFQPLIPSQTKSHWICLLIHHAFNKSAKVYIRMFDLIWVELQRLFFLNWTVAGEKKKRSLCQTVQKARNPSS